MASDEQPPVVAPDEARIEIVIGPEAKISPEVRAALEKLTRVLEERQEIQGYMQCQDISIQPCAMYTICRGVTG